VASRFPLRARLTLWYAGVLTLVLAAYAGGVLAVLRQSLLRDLDRALHDDRETAEGLVAEIGVHMTRFGAAGRLASWAGMCPENNESAGKHGRGTTRKGSTWLRTHLREAAKAAARSKGTYLAAQNTPVSAAGGVPPKRRSRSATRSSWRSTTCSLAASPTTTSAPTTSPAATPANTTRAGSSASSTPLATP
jgi:transposase IS116/IS110/IS902 family protein